MSERKTDSIKLIGNAYQIVKPLFQVGSYFYAQVCCLTNNYEVSNAALYVYENEDPSQTLKMLGQKLKMANKSDYSIIFPHKHLKYTFNDKNIMLYFIKDFMLPFRYYEKRQFSVSQLLEIIYGAVSCLHNLHIREVIHGKVSLNTCYLIRQQFKENCKFALNILDTGFFTEEECLQGTEQRLFLSQGQHLGQKSSYKDDLESLIYVLVHLISKGRMFSIRRFQLQWITESQFLRWKCSDFFKEMIKIVPPQLRIIIELYTIAKAMQRNEKPNYVKILKLILSEMANHAKLSRNKQDIVDYRIKAKQSKVIDQIDETQIKIDCKSLKTPKFDRAKNQNKPSISKMQQVK